MKHPTAKVETVSPENAAMIYALSQNTTQRNLSTAIVSQYAKAMRKGRWQVNGEPIILDENGVCLNGQHRLRAIMSSGCEIDTFVVRGVHTDSFETIDSGKSRTAGDILSADGYSNAKKLAAIAKAVICFERKGINSSGVSLGKGNSIASYEILDMVRASENIEGFVQDHITGDFAALHKHKAMYPGMVYGFLYLLWGKEPEKTVEFMRGVSLCENMEATDPRMVLSNAIMNARAMSKEMKITNDTVLSLYVQAWNAFINETRRKEFKKNLPIPEVRLLEAEYDADEEEYEDE